MSPGGARERVQRWRRWWPLLARSHLPDCRQAVVRSLRLSALPSQPPRLLHLEINYQPSINRPERRVSNGDQVQILDSTKGLNSSRDE